MPGTPTRPPARGVLILALLACVSLSCATTGSPCRGDGWPVPADSLQYRVEDMDGELRRAVDELDVGSLPPDPRWFVIGMISRQFNELKNDKANGAEIWKFHYEKCPNCGWYRSGYVAVRECRVVREVELSDDM